MKIYCKRHGPNTDDVYCLEELLGESHTYSSGSLIWVVSDLWKVAKGVPVEVVDIKSFGALDDWVWESPIALEQFVEHARRMLRADLRYPILVSKSTGSIVDGYHRLIKAKLRNKTTIRVQRIDMPTPNYEVHDEQG